MANTLREAIQEIPEKYARQLSLEDLVAIQKNDVNSVSTRGLQIIASGKQDLGLGEYIDVGASISGAIGGAALGASVTGPFAPIGATVGGIVGGAIGAFGGEVAEDVIADRDVNIGFSSGGAGRAAAESALWDTAFLGAGKVIGPIAARVGISPSQLFNKITGANPGAAAKPSNRVYQEFPENSQESLSQIQSILTEQGGSLTGVQTQKAGFLREFSEQIANVGFLSGEMMEKSATRNVEIFQRGFNDMMQGIDPSLAKGSSDLGQAIVETIDTGERLVKNYYGTALDSIIAKAGTTKVDTGIIQRSIDDIMKKATTDLEIALTDSTISVLRDRSGKLVLDSKIINPVTNNPFKLSKSADLGSLIAYQKMLTKAVEKKRPSLNNLDADEAAYRELGIAERKVKDAITETIARINPKLAKQYVSLNRFYGKSMDALYPEAIGNDLIRAGSKEMYTTLGNVIAGNGDIGKIRKLMSSLDKSFAIAKKTGQPFTGNINTPDRAKALIRQSFIANRIADPATNALDVRKIGKLSEDLKNINTQERYRTVLGDSYPQFKTFIDGVKAVSGKPEAGVLSLSIRGREVGAGLQVAAGLGAGAVGGAMATGAAGAALSIMGPLAVFGIPVVAAKIALNKNAANRLLMLNQAVIKNPQISLSLVSAQVAKILESLSDDDMEDIREGVL